MNKYGYEVLSCQFLNKKNILSMHLDQFKAGDKVAVQVPNTKYIDKSALLYLRKIKLAKGIDLKISVMGPLINHKPTSKVFKEKHFYNSLYDLDELYDIITEFEKIESRIDDSWDEFDIVVYLAETISRTIMYDPEYFLKYIKGEEISKTVGEQDESDFYDRTLRGILSQKTVCAGFALIFKELADRNGIKCKYVSGGLYSESGKLLGGHAWNAIKIAGNKYPLDITEINSRIRSGNFFDIDVLFGDIEHFKRTHFPRDLISNIGLSQFPRQAIRRAKRKTMIKKDYTSTTYIINRSDNTRFLLSQIGLYKGIYRYLYSEINADGSYSLPTVFYSDSNFLGEINDNNFERNDHYYDFMQSFIDILFSRQNLKDSIVGCGSNYIGACQFNEGNSYVDHFHHIVKPDMALRAFPSNNVLSGIRKDGSVVTIIKHRVIPNANPVFAYTVYVIFPGNKVVEYQLLSNTDYFAIDNSLIFNDLLSQDKLDDSLANRGII